MRRQAGASTVDLDTLKGIAEYTIAQPMILDFAMVERASHGAGYKVKEVDVEVTGEITGGTFKVSTTGQQFTLEGDAPKGGIHRLRGKVRGWASGLPTFRVTSGGSNP